MEIGADSSPIVPKERNHLLRNLLLPTNRP